jgi:hypothetical protein
MFPDKIISGDQNSKNNSSAQNNNVASKSEVEKYDKNAYLFWNHISQFDIL